jgi:acetylornithine deacetylase/succinyl-diaminopimelate desuccinylase-like protein
MSEFNQRQQIHQGIDAALPAHLERVRRFIAQPSVAISNEGVPECAALLKDMFMQAGFTRAEIVPTPGFPAVWAELDSGAPKTLAVYQYFDTNVVGAGWTNPPYDAVVAEKAPFKKVLFGRGAGNKGGLAAFLNVVEEIIKVEGRLPVNLLCVIEGDEFLGSNQIPFLIEKFRSKLQKADALFSPRACQTAAGDVTLYLGNKGCLHMELKCSGAQWGRGPVGGAVHSSVQCVVDQPVWRLVSALNTLYDHQTNRILIDGFYDGLRQPTAQERELIGRLAENYKGREAEAIPALVGPQRVPKFIDDKIGADVLLDYCFNPTMNINGIRAGYTGPGTLLWTLPHEAYCTIDIRLPSDLDPQVCLAKVRAHLDAHGYPDISITPLEATMADLPLAVDDELMQASLRVFREWKVEPVIWPRRGAGGPTGFFSKLLGLKMLNTTGMSFASGHSEANEYMVVEGNDKVGGLAELEKSLVDLLFSYAKYPEAW